MTTMQGHDGLVVPSCTPAIAPRQAPAQQQHTTGQSPPLEDSLPARHYLSTTPIMSPHHLHL